MVKARIELNLYVGIIALLFHYWIMPRKCCVPKCNTNYQTGAPGKVFRFPDKEEEKEKWIRAIPRKRESFSVKSHTVVCEKHWPQGYDTYKHYGKDRPIDPPSVFPDIPESCLRSQTKRRTTRKALSVNRSIIPDEIDIFTQSDTLTYDKIVEKTKSIDDLIAFEEIGKESIIIQSTSIENGIPAFILHVKKSLKFS